MQAGCLTACQKRHSCPLFPADHKCLPPESHGALPRGIRQVATADSSTAYSEHKVTVMNDEPVSWQVPSSISVIFSVDEKTREGGKKTENVMGA